jgi:hypothetical protein
MNQPSHPKDNENLVTPIMSGLAPDNNKAANDEDALPASEADDVDNSPQPQERDRTVERQNTSAHLSGG